MSTKNGVSPSRRRAEESLDFLEQLSWLLESKGRRLDLGFLRHVLMDYQERLEIEASLSPSMRRLAKNYVVKNPDKQYLVGVLPELLQDSRLFPSNGDIADFAEKFLMIPMNAGKKRSRHEMIGMVVCSLTEFSNASIERLANRLSRLLSDEHLLRSIVNEKELNALFSWNDVIQRLGK